MNTLQHVLCQLLIEHYSKFGLRVKILPQRFFSIGQQYHRKKNFMRGLLYETLQPRPFVFHWSWTAGKSEKLAYSKETGMWYLRSECSAVTSRKINSNSNYLIDCCIVPVQGNTTENRGNVGTRVSATMRKSHSYLLLPEELPKWATDTQDS